jgi:hypothetical protein
MSNWKAERDAFVSETMAFVEAVRSQMPISTEAVVTPKQLPLGVPESIFSSPRRLSRNMFMWCPMKLPSSLGWSR